MGYLYLFYLGMLGPVPDRYSQPYSVDGSSDVTFVCQFTTEVIQTCDLLRQMAALIRTCVIVKLQLKFKVQVRNSAQCAYLFAIKRVKDKWTDLQNSWFGRTL